MNSKRARVLRKVAKDPSMQETLKIYLSTLHKFIGVQVTERHVYKHIKKLDKSFNTRLKEKFNANQIRSTLS